LGWASAAGLAAPTAFGLDRWPQWRGPERTGHLLDDSAWPSNLNEQSLRLAWEVALGPSYSGPVTDGRVVVTTETVDKQDERVTTYDLATGKLLWTAQWPGAMSVPFFAKANGDWIRSTPAIDGDDLIVGGMKDVIVSLRVSDGKERWRLDFPQQTGSPVPPFGFVCSPLIDGDGVIVQAANALLKLERSSGQTIWKSMQTGDDMMSSGSFSSPLIATVAGQRQLLVQSRTELAGVNIDSGEVLWREDIPAFRGMNILTPTVVGENRIFTSAYGGRSMLFELKPKSGGFDVELVWENKQQAYMSSPVVIENHIYLHLRNQRFVCIDAADGAEKWTTTPFGQYWSMVAIGNRLLALDSGGELLLIEPNPREFTLLDRRKVGENTWAHLGVARPFVLVRDLERLMAFEWQGTA
jgi:outer membrane protein assembly factor BamB